MKDKLKNLKKEMDNKVFKEISFDRIASIKSVLRGTQRKNSRKNYFPSFKRKFPEVVGMVVCATVLFGLFNIGIDYYFISQTKVPVENLKKVPNENENYIQVPKEDLIVGETSVENNNIVLNIQSTTDTIEDFGSIDKLVNGAEIIIQGKVLETKSYVQEPGIITEYKMEVTNSLHGEFTNGDLVDLVSAGGIVPYSEYEEKLKPVDKDFEEKLTNEEKRNLKVQYLFAGAPLIEKGVEYIIFASKYPVSNTKVMYGSIGVYQGQYKIEGDEVVRYNPGTEVKENKEQFILRVKQRIQLKQ